MFDIGWSELVLIGIVALIVIGPKELPGVLRTIGHWSAKIRRMAAEFQGQFQEAMREAELADLKKQVDEINDSARNIGRFDPLTYDPGKATGAPAPPGDADPAAPAQSLPASAEARSPAPAGPAPLPADPVEPGAGSRPA
jgi:sec-independent protein translocase protein TatB